MGFGPKILLVSQIHSSTENIPKIVFYFLFLYDSLALRLEPTDYFLVIGILCGSLEVKLDFIMKVSNKMTIVSVWEMFQILVKFNHV